MKKIFLTIILGMFFIIPLISANGLYINESSMTINKDYGSNYIVSLTISNQETMNFYNISFSDTLKADKFDLASGETKVVNFTIDSNVDLEKNVYLRGYYESNLGTSNKTEEVNIYFESGINNCNLNLVVGDSIKWKNNLLSEIKLRNTDTGEYITTISGSSEYNLKFDNQIEFNYRGLLAGSPFTQICNVNVMGTNGLIHNSDYDATIYLDLNIIYKKTSITKTIYTTEYNLSYNTPASDVITIKNSGSETAKGIHLSGDWITFDKNNFDLSSGSSINVGYTITPIIYQTNQTNQLYNKTILIEGNFDTIEQNLSIFISYKEFSNVYDSEVDELALRNMIRYLCLQNPDWEECRNEVVVSGNTSDNVTITMDEETYKDSLQAQAGFMEEVRRGIKNLEESDSKHEGALISVNQSMNNVTSEVNQVKESITISNASSIILTILFCLLGISVIFFAVIKNKKVKLKISEVLKFHKGEKQL